MSGPYSAIMADPPWPESGGGKIKRGADRHYTLIRKKEDIRDVILSADAWNPADDAHLYLWVTNNFLEWGLWLIPELGFRYVTNFPWTKSGRMGIGQYARGCHELLLFAVRGKGYNACTRGVDGKRATIRSDYLVDVARPTENGKIIHSRKPDAAFELVEARTIGPYLELFSRRQRPGWTCWGNELQDASGGE